MTKFTRLSKHHVTAILEQWGRWSCSGVSKGSLETPTDDNSHWISDEEGLLVDRAVCKLKVNDNVKREMSASRRRTRILNRGLALDLYYIKRYNYPMLANAMKCSENKAIIILNSAEAYIESVLDLDSNVCVDK